MRIVAEGWHRRRGRTVVMSHELDGDDVIYSTAIPEYYEADRVYVRTVDADDAQDDDGYVEIRTGPHEFHFNGDYQLTIRITTADIFRLVAVAFISNPFLARLYRGIRRTNAALRNSPA